MRIVLVCVPADAPTMVPGSAFNRKCVLCGCRLQLAPSGQRGLQEHPDAALICVVCLAKRYHGARIEMLPGAIEEMPKRVPNMWRSRN